MRFAGALLCLLAGCGAGHGGGLGGGAGDRGVATGSAGDTGCTFPWYPDADGDGWGRSDTPTCDASVGFTTQGGDCDDGDATVNPDVEEVCDGRDEDCDGTVDDTYSVVYADTDGDGWGGDAWQYGCESPGWVSRRIDCDDTDAARNPDVTEVCGDGIDSDCDGADCFLLALPDARSTLLGHADAGNAGAALAVGGDADGPELLVGAPGIATAYVVPRVAPGQTSLLDTGTLLLGEPGSRAGTALAMGPDLDDDGVRDVYVGAPGGTGPDGVVRDGEVLVYAGGLAGTSGVADARDRWQSPEDDGAGAALAIVGTGADATLVIGAPTSTRGGVGSGAVWSVPLGETAGRGGDWPLPDVATVSVGTAGDSAGRAVANVGDLDGDGLAEVGIGAPGHIADGDTDAGAVYLLAGGAAPSAQLADADAVLEGPVAWQQLGGSLCGAGDIDGDGYADLAAGTAADVVSVWNGGVGLPHGSRTVKISVSAYSAFDAQAIVVAPAGDVDGDTRADLLVGSPIVFYRHGAAWIFADLDAASGTVDVAYAWLRGEGGDDARGEGGTGSGGTVGAALAAPGDLDGDGLDDVAIGAPFQDGPGGQGAGTVYLVPITPP